jgi:hypothetical protein
MSELKVIVQEGKREDTVWGMYHRSHVQKVKMEDRCNFGHVRLAS